jgi:dual specificity phosphatase 12
LKEISESACPNDGFLDQVRFVHDLLAVYELQECLLLSQIFSVVQLKLFEEMGFKVDTSSPLYKRFRLKILG